MVLFLKLMEHVQESEQTFFDFQILEKYTFPQKRVTTLRCKHWEVVVAQLV